MISLLCIEVLGTWLVGGERSDTVHKSLLYEVVTEVHIVLFAYGECYVERTGPVALCQHLEHHEVALVECALAGKRDDHLVWNSICSHHHTALLYSLLVDGDIEGICRDEVHVRVLAAYPVLQDVLELERFVTKLLLGILWILLVEVENLLLCFRLNRYIFIGT